MRFDREAPGEGAEAICGLENGKAVLEWRFYFAEGAGDGGKSSCLIRIVLTDMGGNTVLEGIQPLHEEEPLRSVLLQPRLWRGTEDPYLYCLEAYLTDRDGRCLDSVSRPLALRVVSGIGDAGRILLNGEVLERRAVSYCPPSASSEAERVLLMEEDLRRIRRLGANCVLAEGGDGPGRSLLHLCDRYGFLLFSGEKGGAGYARFCGDDSKSRIPWEEPVPCFRGEKDCLFPGADGLPGSLFYRDSGLPACLFAGDSTLPTSLFYRYLAKWSREPFVYIVPESVKRLESGNYSVRCYSNCERIVLYSDGALFEFQRGKEEFSFSEVPAKTPCIMLTAEGDGCSASLSLSKSACLWEKGD